MSTPTKRTDTAAPLSTDQRYSSYVQMACNLDSILWNTQATLLGITVLSWGAVGIILEKGLEMRPLSHNHTVAAVLLIASALYFVTIFIVIRIRFWHKRVELELANIEGSGYFSKRQEPHSYYLRAPIWVATVFGMLAAAMALFALALLFTPQAQARDMKPITPAEAEKNDGVTTLHEVMPNGERRFRLRTADGNGYILTRSTTAGWQKSHRHDRVAETYIVEKGWMLFATKGPEGTAPQVRKLGPGDTITSPVGGVHNVYMGPDSEIHTVKHGARSGERDWIADPAFDEVTQRIPVG